MTAGSQNTTWATRAQLLSAPDIKELWPNAAAGIEGFCHAKSCVGRMRYRLKYKCLFIYALVLITR